MLNSSSVHLVLVHNIHTFCVRFRESINLSAFSRMTPGANTCESRSEKGRGEGGRGGGPPKKKKKKLKKTKYYYYLFFFFFGPAPPPAFPIFFFFFWRSPPPPWGAPPPPIPHQTRTCELRVTPYLTMYVFVYLCRHSCFAYLLDARMTCCFAMF